MGQPNSKILKTSKGGYYLVVLSPRLKSFEPFSSIPSRKKTPRHPFWSAFATFLGRDAPEHHLDCLPYFYKHVVMT